MKCAKLALATIMVLLLGATGPLCFGAATSTSFPFSLSVFVPCAAGGVGEVVDLSGSLHLITSITINGNNLHFNQLANPQGISGVGETTGDKYQATGETRTDVNTDLVAFPYITTFVNNFRIIGQGPDNNFLVHETAHETINANGTLTANFDHFSVSCQ